MTTITDAETALSGVLDWEFGGKASFEGLVKYAFENYDYIDEGDKNTDDEGNKNAIIIAYLKSVGENPDEYDVGK